MPLRSAGVLLQHGRHPLHHIQTAEQRPPGRCTLSTTRRPLRRLARCTCAREAAPQGVRVEVDDLSAALPQLLLQHGLNLSS